MITSEENAIISGGTIDGGKVAEIGPTDTEMPGMGEKPLPELFPDPVILRLCSANVCTQGHEWIPKVTLAKCGYGTPQGWNGCGAPVLAVKMESCPVCNEPVAKMRFRTDHTPPTQFIIPICIPGSVTHADVAEVVLSRNFKEVEKAYDGQYPPRQTE